MPSSDSEPREGFIAVQGCFGPCRPSLISDCQLLPSDLRVVSQDSQDWMPAWEPRERPSERCQPCDEACHPASRALIPTSHCTCTPSRPPRPTPGCHVEQPATADRPQSVGHQRILQDGQPCAAWCAFEVCMTFLVLSRWTGKARTNRMRLQRLLSARFRPFDHTTYAASSC